MKRILAIIALAIGLVAFAPAPDADAHYQEPGVWYRSYVNCTNDSIYGTYGNGFAQMRLVSSNCSAWSQVGVTTVDAYGVQRVAWCNLYTALFYPSASCVRADGGGHTGIMVLIPGTAISYATIGCYDTPSGPQCRRQDHGIFMPNNGLHTPPQF